MEVSDCVEVEFEQILHEKSQVRDPAQVGQKVWSQMAGLLATMYEQDGRQSAIR